jgi:uncharacterized protein DUF6496
MPVVWSFGGAAIRNKCETRPFSFYEREGSVEYDMARRYSRSASKDVKRAMHRRKRGTLKSGKGGRGGRVRSRKQAIAIGLSEARRKGKKVPRKRSSKR